MRTAHKQEAASLTISLAGNDVPIVCVWAKVSTLLTLSDFNRETEIKRKARLVALPAFPSCVSLHECVCFTGERGC